MKWSAIGRRRRRGRPKGGSAPWRSTAAGGSLSCVAASIRLCWSIRPTAVCWRSFGHGEVFDAHGIAIDARDRVFVVDRDAHEVICFSTRGEVLFRLGARHRPHWAKPFNHPTDVAVAPDGEIYVSDGYGNGRVHVFDPGGALRLSFGAVGNARRRVHDAPCAADRSAKSGRRRRSGKQQGATLRPRRPIFGRDERPLPADGRVRARRRHVAGDRRRAQRERLRWRRRARRPRAPVAARARMALQATARARSISPRSSRIRSLVCVRWAGLKARPSPPCGGRWHRAAMTDEGSLQDRAPPLTPPTFSKARGGGSTPHPALRPLSRACDPHSSSRSLARRASRRSSSRSIRRRASSFSWPSR